MTKRSGCRVRAVVILGMLVLGTFAPVVAGWRGLEGRDASGTDEPNTVYDTSSVMWHTGNEDAVERVYFDIALIQRPTTVSPNYGAGSRLEPVVLAEPRAYLGFWRDCNGDGYIGDASTGSRVYVATSPTPACLSINTPSCSLIDCCWFPNPQPCCPPTALSCPYYRFTVEGVDFIDEFREIGPEVHGNGAADEGVRVWADWGHPAEGEEAYATFPPRAGTLSTTGGHLRWVDGVTSGALGSLAQDNGLGSTWRDLTCASEDPATPGPSPDQPCPGSLNSGNPVGYYAREAYNNRVSATNGESSMGGGRYASDGSSAWVRVDWDCANPVRDPVLGEAILASPAGVRPNFDLSDNPPYGSLNGQLHEIDHGLVVGREDGGCDPTPEGLRPGGLEGPEGISGPAKNQVDVGFTWVVPRNCWAIDPPPEECFKETVEPGPACIWIDLECCPVGDDGRPGCVCTICDSNGVWSGGLVIHRRNTGLLAQDYWSGYARVTPDAFLDGATPDTALPAGSLGAHVYGLEGCSTGSGAPGIVEDAGFDGILGTGDDPSVINPSTGWECNRGVWAYHGSLAGTPTRVGDAYDLRDVDCFDNDLGVDVLGIRLQAGLAPLCPT